MEGGKLLIPNISVTSHKLDYEFKSVFANSELQDSLLLLLLKDITA